MAQTPPTWAVSPGSSHLGQGPVRLQGRYRAAEHSKTVAYLLDGEGAPFAQRAPNPLARLG